MCMLISMRVVDTAKIDLSNICRAGFYPLRRNLNVGVMTAVGVFSRADLQAAASLTQPPPTSPLMPETSFIDIEACFIGQLATSQ